MPGDRFEVKESWPGGRQSKRPAHAAANYSTVAFRDAGRGGTRFPALKYRAKVIPPLYGEDAANGTPGPGRTDPKWRVEMRPSGCERKARSGTTAPGVAALQKKASIPIVSHLLPRRAVWPIPYPALKGRAKLIPPLTRRWGGVAAQGRVESSASVSRRLTARQAAEPPEMSKLEPPLTRRRTSRNTSCHCNTSACNFQTATFSLQLSNCDFQMRLSACDFQPATCNLWPATANAQP